MKAYARILATCIILAVTDGIAGDVAVQHVVDKGTGLDATVVSIVPANNHGFATKYPNVSQTGPFVIDPGGQIGIRSNDGFQAERTLIGQTTDGQILIMVTKPITLFTLAEAIKTNFPKIDRLLNLDGGPSTAMKTAEIEVLNRGAVRNYIAKRTEPKREMMHEPWTAPSERR